MIKFVSKLGSCMTIFEADTVDEMAELLRAVDIHHEEREERRRKAYAPEFFIVPDNAVPDICPNTRRRK